MLTNPLRQLKTLGQSVWLDYIRRDLIIDGKLHRMIEDDGLQGMTSNPSIFEKSIAESHEYDDDIHAQTLQNKDYKSICENISLDDVRSAADIFRQVYDESNGKDGYVSLEVDPHLAFNTNATIEEARRLWVALNRPNVFIKVPATDQGIPAITQLISEGINVNVTLLFGLSRYQQVIRAYTAGLEERLNRSLPVNKIASVASFFVSRIDSLVDPQLEKIMEQGGKKAEIAKKLYGQVAIANARIAYSIFRKNFDSTEFKSLMNQGANIQRLLWASTSTKNQSFSDIVYVESLIAPDTVNTMPLETFNAYRDHGNPKIRIEEDIDLDQWILEELPAFGINYDNMIQQLEMEGINKFTESYEKLIKTLAQTVPLHL